jgi:hypothetical protein
VTAGLDRGPAAKELDGLRSGDAVEKSGVRGQVVA